MPIMTLRELLDFVIMTAAIGFIFYDVFQRFRPHRHELAIGKFSINDFLFACAVIAPAIIAHELAHKFVAMAFGFAATYKAAYLWLGIGLVMKLLNFGFIFFIPAYTQIVGITVGLNSAVIAFTGPAINGLIWLAARTALRSKRLNRKYIPVVFLTKQINGFLCIFNLLPIPLFDGFNVIQGLLKAFF